MKREIKIERVDFENCTDSTTEFEYFDSSLNIAPPAVGGHDAKRMEFPHMKREIKGENYADYIAEYFKYASLAPAVAGGYSAKRLEFPHMALLGYGDNIETAEWLCGGSVISERFILTAGHCLSSPRVGSVRYIALGILKRSDPQELWQKYNVKTIVRHPLYNPPSKYHDIALLETDKDIVFSSDVRPACLHADDQEDQFAIATGWGALGHRQGLADVLQYVGLHKFTKEQCAQNYGPHRHLRDGYDHNTQMCYGDIQDQAIPTDTCSGDSGGPLQSSDHVQCMYTIIGVTSYGRQCGLSGGSGMYTRVNNYVAWIESVVWP